MHENAHVAHDASLLPAAIDDLHDVKMFLKRLVEWMSLGLALGLLYPTLEKIENDCRDNTDKCKTKMLAAWLQQRDNVPQKGVPSWLVLRAALQETEEKELADRIVSKSLICLWCAMKNKLLCYFLIWKQEEVKEEENEKEKEEEKVEEKGKGGGREGREGRRGVQEEVEVEEKKARGKRRRTI